jgi:hypothetical protein
VSTVDSEMLRSLVREALRDALGSTPGAIKLPAAPAAQPAVTEVVSLNSDADLAAFVQRILDMAADAGTLAQLRAGRVAFQLAGKGAGTSSASSAPVTSGMRVDKGALTESMVRKAAESGNAIHVSRKVVILSLIHI